MSNELIALKAVSVLGVSGVTSVGVTPSLVAQLNALYPFLYLSLPLWYFFVMVVIVCFIGAIGALLTDVMDNEPNSLKKIGLAFGTGLVSAFIVLPSLVAAPSMGTLLLTALGASFSGTILVFIFVQVLKDKAIQTTIKQTISKTIIYGFSKLGSFIDLLTGGKK